MKGIFTISVAAVMALIMMLSFTACGNSTLGYYKLDSISASGISLDGSNLATFGMGNAYLLLKEDGKAELSVAGKTTEATYDDKTITSNGESLNYTLKDGVITIKSDDEGTMVFKYDANFKPEASTTESSK